MEFKSGGWGVGRCLIRVPIQNFPRHGERGRKYVLVCLEGDIFFHPLNTESYGHCGKELGLTILYNYRLSLLSIGEVKIEYE